MDPAEKRLAKLHRRLRLHESRLAVRRWEYRQRHHSKGVWARLRRVLAMAEHAYIVDDEQVAALVREGFRPEPVGHEVEPPRTWIFVPPERAAALHDAQPVPLRLGATLLGASALVLVRFPRTLADGLESPQR